MSKVMLLFLLLSLTVVMSGVKIFPQTENNLVLSEIMFYAGGNNEFVEIYNSSETESLDILGFSIKYYTSKPDVITDAGFGTILPPKNFAVILEGDYNFTGGIYNNLIPQSALIVKISDNSFGTSGMANTAGRSVALLNTGGQVIDSCTYTADNPENISDEKIVLASGSNSSGWGNSECIYGTPGFRNSVTPYNYDLEVDYVYINPAKILTGNHAEIKTKIRNRGLLNCGKVYLGIYDDAGYDSMNASKELIFEKQFTGLNKDDSVSALFSFTPAAAGWHKIIAVINSEDDENARNDTLFSFLYVYTAEHKYNDIIVNEIMYAPKNDEPEWIEFYNRSGEKINLKGWSVSDNSSTVPMIKNDFYLNAGSYLVVCKDSTVPMAEKIRELLILKNLPTLNNSGDNIILKDSLEFLIDSIFYKPDWGGENGKSLERKEDYLESNDPSAWGTCISQNNCTPGSINSISRKDYDIKVLKILCNPEMPLVGDNVSLSALIQNTGKQPADFRLELFEDINLDSLFENHSSFPELYSIKPGDSAVYALNYNIRNINSKKLVKVKANSSNDQDTSNNYCSVEISPGYKPSVILINEIMPNPSGGEPEWIELYNNSNETVDLSGWTVNDVITRPFVVTIKDRIILPSESFLILTADSSIYNYHKNVPCLTSVLNIPLLNNDEDGVVLKDCRGMIIDSMFYSNKDYKLTKGYSLERRSLKFSSVMKDNWEISKDNEQSTPGRVNSISQKKYDLYIRNIESEPGNPVAGEDVIISVKILNIGEIDAANYKVEFYYKSGGDKNSYSLLSGETGRNIKPGDSAIVFCSRPLQNIKDEILLMCRIIYPEDEDTSNNYFYRKILTGYPEGTVEINEIMYAPGNGEPEWFELYNTSLTNSVNLKNWNVSEILPDQKKYIISDTGLFIDPDEYMIITKDKSFFNFYPQCSSKVKIMNFGTLGNSEDGIVLFDARNIAIDSVFYRSGWGGRDGRSLERISSSAGSGDSANWKTSVSETNATPGYRNSVVNLIPYDRCSMVINEIMYDPSEGNSEYLELVNISQKPVNLLGWSAVDDKGNRAIVYGSNLVVQPGSYFLLASDSSLYFKYEFKQDAQINIAGTGDLSLSNGGEMIIVKDALNNTIDSIIYSPNWHNKNFNSKKNISLEKINPALNGNLGSNWSSSVDIIGGTPGKKNSVYTDNNKTGVKLSVSPNPFSPDNDGFEDFTLIKFRLQNKTARIRIRIFNSRGYLVRTLEDCMQNGQEGSVVFDGFSDNKNPLRMGIYIIFLEAFNDNSAILESMKTVVVVARKLN